MANLELIQQNLNNTLTETNLTGFKKLHTGKVRDTYEHNGQRIIVSTDRQSAFDRILGAIPFKGAVLNQFSHFWFEQTKDICPNHHINIPDPNVAITKSLKIFPVEIIVRGYLTGTTSTSAWVNYQNGERDFGGIKLPEGMKKNQPFPKAVITPTTKPESGHDEKISKEEIINRKLMTSEEWNQIEEYALKIFAKGQQIAKEKGFILVDTKYEFGVDHEGKIVLADEVHTPDSSRYWVANTYEQRMADGQEPDNFDKEFFRLWFKENCDPYQDEILPEAPDKLRIELASRYIDIYEKITGNSFNYTNGNPEHRIQDNLNHYFDQQEVVGNS